MAMSMPGCVGQALAVWHSLGATQEVPGSGVASSWQTPGRVAVGWLSSRADESCGKSVVQHARMQGAWEIPHNVPCPLPGFIQPCMCAQIWVSLVHMGG